MKVSKHNYIPDIKFHPGIHCDDYLIYQGFGLTILPIK
jgi:hypothetical protein